MTQITIQGAVTLIESEKPKKATIDLLILLLSFLFIFWGVFQYKAAVFSPESWLAFEVEHLPATLSGSHTWCFDAFR